MKKYIAPIIGLIIIGLISLVLSFDFNEIVILLLSMIYIRIYTNDEE